MMYNWVLNCLLMLATAAREHHDSKTQVTLSGHGRLSVRMEFLKLLTFHNIPKPQLVRKQTSNLYKSFHNIRLEITSVPDPTGQNAQGIGRENLLSVSCI